MPNSMHPRAQPGVHSLRPCRVLQSLPGARRQHAPLRLCKQLQARAPSNSDPDLFDETTNLKDFGYTDAEIEAEESFDSTEIDPTAINFDDIFSLQDNLPEDMKEALSADQYGPPVRHDAARPHKAHK